MLKRKGACSPNRSVYRTDRREEEIDTKFRHLPGVVPSIGTQSVGDHLKDARCTHQGRKAGITTRGETNSSAEEEEQGKEGQEEGIGYQIRSIAVRRRHRRAGI